MSPRDRIPAAGGPEGGGAGREGADGRGGPAAFLAGLVTRFFVLWIILFSAAAYARPAAFEKLGGLIVPTLAAIMFAMGTTLRADDFRKVLSEPAKVLAGVSAQYAVMPLLGFVLASAFGAQPLAAAGVILVGSCPGGTASNVITYLARGDLALSVTLTAVSTLLCPLLLPALMYAYAGKWVDVPVAALFFSAFQIVLLPVFLGIVSAKLLGKRTRGALPFLPPLSSLAIILVVAVIVALNSGSLAAAGMSLFAAVALHNILGLGCGYALARTLGFGEGAARAISIEVGMQNSGLAAALSHLHFGNLSALPAAIFSVWHNVSGAALARIWRDAARRRT